MKTNTMFLGLLTMVLTTSVGALSLEVGTELTLDPPWTTPVPLGPLTEGHFRVEATTLGGDPVEILVESSEPGGAWRVEGTNRSLQGRLNPWVDVTGSSRPQRVRPLQPQTTTIVLRLRPIQFSEFRNSLKQGLTQGPPVSVPLHPRLALPPGTGGSGLAVASGPSGQLWIGWLTDAGWTAEVWDAQTGQRVGPVIRSAVAPWSSLSLKGSATPELTLHGDNGEEGRLWTGGAWVTEAAPEGHTLVNAWGTFRTQTSPVRVLQAKPTGWQDLALPRDDDADLVLLGSTEDGLAAFLASSKTAHRAFYRWKPLEGWRALPPPPASGPPWAELWAVTTGTATLYHLEGREKELLLRPFDGTEWHPALDLSPLAPDGARAAALVPPSAWSRTGALVLVTDRVTVYDLP